LPEARAEFDQLKKFAPEHPETLLVEARLAYADKDFKRTIELTDRLLKGLPDSVNALELAGAAELGSRKYGPAETHLGQALKLAPQLLRPRLLLAQTHLGSGQPEKALQLLQPILEAKTPDAASLSLAGEAYLQMGDNKRSEAVMKQALKAAPDSAAVRTAAAIAQAVIGEGNPAALSELESAASADKSSRADLALISARMAQSDTAGALKAIDALEKKQADKRLPKLLRGRVLMMRKDHEGARRSLEAALAEDAAYFPAVAALGAIDLAEGKPELTRKSFEAFLAANPKSFRAKLALAELEIRTGGPSAQVVALLREAVKIDPTQAASHLLLIGRLGSNGDTKGALVAAQEAAAALPDNLDVQEALGGAQMAAGDAQVAVTTLKKLTGLQPRKAGYLLRLADSHRANKDDASARVALKQALALDPDLNAARSGLIGLALRDQHPDDALALAREAQQRKPRDATGFLLEGDIEASRKHWDAAVVALRAALQRNRSVGVVVKLHAALTAGGMATEADRLVADWTKDYPKDPVFAYYLGDLALSRSDLPGAEARYRSVLDLQPQNALAMNNVAWLMTRQGKPGAVTLAEKANEILPDRAPLLDTLSLALENNQQLPKAIEVQARAVKLQPGDPSFSMRLARLYIKAGQKDKARSELEALARLGTKFAEQAEVEKLLKSL
jgi:putative PEP-CTERM system TPR-repeat lipoprotein